MNPIVTKKLLIVTLHDGRKIEIDLAKHPQAPVGYNGSPAEHPFFVAAVTSVTQQGLADSDACTPLELVHIMPYQIAGIKVKFETAEPMLLNIVD